MSLLETSEVLHHDGHDSFRPRLGVVQARNVSVGQKIFDERGEQVGVQVRLVEYHLRDEGDKQHELSSSGNNF